jgi:serine/arginine repetitive matrix protein 2
MLGGGHVVDLFDLSLKHLLVSALKNGNTLLPRESRFIKARMTPNDSANKARIVEKPSIASTSSYQFGGERIIKAQRGVLERQSLEDNCLSADGEEMSSACTFFSGFSIMIHY